MGVPFLDKMMEKIDNFQLFTMSLLKWFTDIGSTFKIYHTNFPWQSEKEWLGFECLME